MYVTRRAGVLTALALTGVLGLSACGSDDNTPSASGDANTTTTAPAAKTIAVKGIDYTFEGLPAKVAAGTTFTFTNASTKESHEMVMFKLAAGEKRSLKELLDLPEEEAAKVTGEPLAVVVAPTPGGEGKVVVGEAVAKDPGRYVVLCGLPTGGDPKVIEEAAKNGAPPPDDPNAGPPHFTKGMIQEFTVA